MKKMLAGVIDGPGKIIVKDVEIEELKDNEVLVRIDACGISENDLNTFNNDPPIARFWAGSEISGRVEEKGAGAGGPELGTRVSVMPLIPCGECKECHADLENICSNLSFIGFDRPGGFAEFVVVPDTNVFELPENFDHNIAVLVEPIACVFHSTGIAGNLKGKHVVVFGCETIGLITVLLARLEGAKSVTAIGRYIHQRDVAKHSGAEIVFSSESSTIASDVNGALNKKFGECADIVFETIGDFNATTITESIEILHQGGVIVLPGSSFDESITNREDLREKEIELRGTERYNRIDFQNAVDLIKTHGVRVFNLNPLVSHRVDLDEIARAYEIGLSKEMHRTIKVVINP